MRELLGLFFTFFLLLVSISSILTVAFIRLPKGSYNFFLMLALLTGTFATLPLLIRLVVISGIGS